LHMKIGEVCLNTNDVVKLANFYKQLFEIDNGSNDETHQILISEEPQFSIYNDGSHRNSNSQNICLAFTVNDIYAKYEKLLALGVEIIEKPTKRPWGTINMRFYDPDRNLIYFRSFLD